MAKLSRRKSVRKNLSKRGKQALKRVKKELRKASKKIRGGRRNNRKRSLGKKKKNSRKRKNMKGGQVSAVAYAPASGQYESGIPSEGPYESDPFYSRPPTNAEISASEIEHAAIDETGDYRSPEYNTRQLNRAEAVAKLKGEIMGNETTREYTPKIDDRLSYDERVALGYAGEGRSSYFPNYNPQQGPYDSATTGGSAGYIPPSERPNVGVPPSERPNVGVPPSERSNVGVPPSEIPDVGVPPQTDILVGTAVDLSGFPLQGSLAHTHTSNDIIAPL